MTDKDLLGRATREIEATERLLDVAVAARRLTVSAETIRAWCRGNKIRFVRTPTGRYKVPAAVVDALLQIKSQDTQTSQT